ncbi:MAG: hypothetical protein ACOYIP_00075 [Coriobacteriales bacterium]|jgi:hypothetical protein
MKKLLTVLTIAIAAAACAFVLAACGPTQKMQTVDMGDYLFEAPEEWGAIQQEYDDGTSFWMGGEEASPLLTLDRSALDIPEGAVAADVMAGHVAGWFHEGGDATYADVEDFTVGDLPARAGVVSYGDGTAMYQILFSPDALDFVVMNVTIESPEDADGIALGKAIRDSIALPQV